MCGSEVRRRYLPSRFSSALIFALSILSSLAGVTRRNRFRAGRAARLPSSFARSER
jgi:hypothetical protein